MKNEFINFQKLIDSLVQEGWFFSEKIIPAQLCQDLLLEAKGSHFQKAKIGKGAQTLREESIRTDEIFWLSQNESTRAQSDYLALMEELRLEINKSLYLGLREYECHFAKYNEQGFYKKHLDQHKNCQARLVSTVTYLNTPTAGGELIIYQRENPDQVSKVIKPSPGAFVCFLSEEIYHEVKQTYGERFSVTGWFRRD